MILTLTKILSLLLLLLLQSMLSSSPAVHVGARMGRKVVVFGCIFAPLVAHTRCLFLLERHSFEPADFLQIRITSGINTISQFTRYVRVWMVKGIVGGRFDRGYFLNLLWEGNGFAFASQRLDGRNIHTML